MGDENVDPLAGLEGLEASPVPQMGSPIKKGWGKAKLLKTAVTMKETAKATQDRDRTFNVINRIVVNMTLQERMAEMAKLFERSRNGTVCHDADAAAVSQVRFRPKRYD